MEKPCIFFPSNVHFTLAEFTNESKIQLALAMWNSSFLAAEHGSFGFVPTHSVKPGLTTSYTDLAAQSHYKCVKQIIKLKRGSGTPLPSCCPGAPKTTELALGEEDDNRLQNALIQAFNTLIKATGQVYQSLS